MQTMQLAAAPAAGAWAWWTLKTMTAAAYRPGAAVHVWAIHAQTATEGAPLWGVLVSKNTQI